MNRHIRHLVGIALAVGLVLASSLPAVSQQPAPPAQGPMREKLAPMPEDGPRADTFTFVTGEMSWDGKLVKGAPYSAQAVTEMIQTLSDGNRIINKSTASVFRDSEGRTRREQTLRAIGPFAGETDLPQTIFINDPVAKMNYMLDVRSRTARKMPAFRFEVKTPMPPPGSGDAVFTVEAPPPATPPKGGEATGYAFTTTPAPEGGYRMEYFGGSKRTKSEALGKRTIEGVEAEGSRDTVTIPIGEIGNEMPIEIVSERWYSNELQTLVMTKHSDPRFGETTYRLTNIDRSEPAKSLFEIPSDYVVKGGDSYTWTEATPGTPATAIAGVAKAAQISGGVLNGKAISLPPPVMPAVARTAHASGSVTVQVTVDEEGNVAAAKAVAGHPLLQAAAVTAARQAKFSPTKLQGQPVRVQGVLVYNFE